MKRLSWATRLERAEKRGSFFKTERKLAASWLTCAIGERNDWPTEAGWHPEYRSEENYLGMDFFSAIQTQDISRAKEVYAKIQALP